MRAPFFLQIRFQSMALSLLCLSLVAFGGQRHSEYDGRVAAQVPIACAHYKFLFFQLYRAELWTDSTDMPGTHFGLTVIYDYHFKQHDLVRTSISEMARISGRTQSDFAAVRLKLDGIMRDVSKGDRFTAWKAEAGDLEFFLNGEFVGVLDQHVDLFLAIWLSDKSRKPELAKRLLSGKCDQ